MASSASVPAPAKRLKEHLQDQQEPFNLHSYLSERSYVKSSCSLEHSVDSAKSPTRPPSSGIHKGRNGILHAKRILASAMYKLIPTDTSRVYSWRSKRNQGLTNASTTIAFEIGNSETVEIAADTRFHWICVEDHLQLRSASLLRESLSNKAGDFNKKAAPSGHSFIPSKRDAGDSPLSASLFELLTNSPIEKNSHVTFAKVKGISWNDSRPTQHLRNKRLLQRRKQFVFDYEKEAMTHGRKDDRNKYTQHISDRKDMEKIIYARICSCGKRTTNTSHQMDFDFSTTFEEWSDFQHLKRKICAKIGDDIMDEIVKEMTSLFCSK